VSRAALLPAGGRGRRGQSHEGPAAGGTSCRRQELSSLESQRQPDRQPQPQLERRCCLPSWAVLPLRAGGSLRAPVPSCWGCSELKRRPCLPGAAACMPQCASLLLPRAGADGAGLLRAHVESKAWEVDTLRGHTNNVSCVMFHARQVRASGGRGWGWAAGRPGSFGAWMRVAAGAPGGRHAAESTSQGAGTAWRCMALHGVALRGAARHGTAQHTRPRSQLGRAPALHAPAAQPPAAGR
jgi:hypothetical protein